MGQLERWKERLSNLTVSPLTRKSWHGIISSPDIILKVFEGDYPDPSQLAPESARRPIEACETLEISEDAQTALQRLQEINGGSYSSFSVLLSALVILLSRLTGDDNIAVGTGCSDQLPFVLRAAIDPNEAFSTLLARIGEVFILPRGFTQAIYLRFS